MARKSKLLTEIGEIIKNKEELEIDKIENIDYEILKELNKKFMYLEDERDGNYGLYYMNEVVIIVFLALLANCDEWIQIRMFAVKHYEWLKNFLNLHYGIPSVSTISRIMSMVDPKELEIICVDFIFNKVKEIEKKIHIENKRDITILDGKVAKSSGRTSSKKGEVKKVQAMSAYSMKYDMTLATEFIEDKTNEIPTAPKLLNRLDLTNTIVTFDALNTQEKTIEHIIKNHGDYVAPVKANQEILYQDLIDYFEIDNIKNEMKYFITTEKNHSQIEIRKYYLTEDVNWISNKKKWKNLTSIGMIEKECQNINTGEIKIERRYYITSLYEIEIKDFIDAVRGEWTIENNLHWHLDVTFKEDRNLCSQKLAQKNLNILRKLGLNILKIAQPLYKLSLKNIRFQLSMDFENEFNKLLSILNEHSLLEFIESSKIHYL